MRAPVLVVLALGVACGNDDPVRPPPLGPASSTPTTATIGVSTSPDTSSSDATASTSTSTDTGNGETDASVETGSDTPCGDWAEVWVGCRGQGVVADAEQQCETDLVGWEEQLPSCRLLAEEVRVCVAQLPCQEFLDWEINRAVPLECASEIDALEQMCAFVGTTSA